MDHLGAVVSSSNIYAKKNYILRCELEKGYGFQVFYAERMSHLHDALHFVFHKYLLALLVYSKQSNCPFLPFRKSFCLFLMDVE